MIPTWIWLVFLFALGSSIGSFLNVVVYRLPREMSLVRPGSRCSSCETPIAWYDNIPVVSWLVLQGRCRRCGATFSVRYAIVELATGLVFAGVWWAYFEAGVRAMPGWLEGGWAIYLGHIVLICGLLASSLIDAEHWIIPLSVSYLVAGVGAAMSGIYPYVVDWPVEELARVVPWASPRSGAWALGATAGLGVTGLALWQGWITRSFAEVIAAEEQARRDGIPLEKMPEVPVNARGEMVRELAFLAPVVLGGFAALWLLTGTGPGASWWADVLAGQKWLAGLLGSVFGFMIGAGVVWATRILGTLVFGREAMGLGDVHLMGAVGAVLGWVVPTVAFFLAPFAGLGWALARLILHRAREIPYGPFLSVATVVMILAYDVIVDFLAAALAPATGW